MHEARILGRATVALSITLSLLALAAQTNGAQAPLDVTLGEYPGTR